MILSIALLTALIFTNNLDHVSFSFCFPSHLEAFVRPGSPFQLFSEVPHLRAAFHIQFFLFGISAFSPFRLFSFRAGFLSFYPGWFSLVSFGLSRFFPSRFSPEWLILDYFLPASFFRTQPESFSGIGLWFSILRFSGQSFRIPISSLSACLYFFLLFAVFPLFLQAPCETNRFLFRVSAFRSLQFFGFFQ